jgi:nicotinamidase-related amidase
VTVQCLIIIDMLHDYLDRWGVDRRVGLVDNTNRLIEVFRKAYLPVIWVRQEFRPDLSDAFLTMRDEQISITIEGTHGAQIHSDLAYRSSDATIIKKRYSAFFRTNLDDLLADSGAQTLVMAGINTHACVRMAAIDAYQRDFRVVIASECVGSYDDEHAKMSLNYMDGGIASVMTNTQIFDSLKPL